MVRTTFVGCAMAPVLHQGLVDVDDPAEKCAPKLHKVIFRYIVNLQYWAERIKCDPIPSCRSPQYHPTAALDHFLPRSHRYSLKRRRGCRGNPVFTSNNYVRVSS